MVSILGCSKEVPGQPDVRQTPAAESELSEGHDPGTPGGVGEPRPADPELDPEPFQGETLAAKTHRVLSKACGTCHLGSISEQPAALGIFDLEQPGWVDGISPAGLESIPERMDATGLPQDEIDAVIAYVSQVYVDRAGPPATEDCA